MNWKKLFITAGVLFLLLVIADPPTAADMVQGALGITKDAASSMKAFVVAVFN